MYKCPIKFSKMYIYNYSEEQKLKCKLRKKNKIIGNLQNTVYTLKEEINNIKNICVYSVPQSFKKKHILKL